MRNQKAIDAFITAQLSAHVTVNDIIAVLSIMYKTEFPSKSDARTYLSEYMTDNKLHPTKKETKSGALKAWVLSNENPVSITKSQIKDKCIELDMKGGSITYYVNSYSLAFELAAKLATK